MDGADGHQPPRRSGAGRPCGSAAAGACRRGGRLVAEWLSARSTAVGQPRQRASLFDAGYAPVADAGAEGLLQGRPPLAASSRSRTTLLCTSVCTSKLPSPRMSKIGTLASSRPSVTRPERYTTSRASRSACERSAVGRRSRSSPPISALRSTNCSGLISPQPRRSTSHAARDLTSYDRSWPGTLQILLIVSQVPLVVAAIAFMFKSDANQYFGSQPE